MENNKREERIERQRRISEMYIEAYAEETGLDVETMRQRIKEIAQQSRKFDSESLKVRTKKK